MPTSTQALPEPRANGIDIAGAPLLELFSPERRPGASPVTPIDARRPLWAADTAHRAHNLAQMSSALSSDRFRHLHGDKADEHGAQARALSRAYAELGAEEIAGLDVPCGFLLDVIATRLVAIFSGDKTIGLQVSIDHLVLPANQRRALILIASELIINALKYAFPARLIGEISLALTTGTDGIELVIADDGWGISADAPRGSGYALISNFAAMLAAEVELSDNAPGLKVRVSMPYPSV